MCDIYHSCITYTQFPTYCTSDIFERLRSNNPFQSSSANFQNGSAIAELNECVLFSRWWMRSWRRLGAKLMLKQTKKKTWRKKPSTTWTMITRQRCRLRTPFKVTPTQTQSSGAVVSGLWVITSLLLTGFRYGSDIVPFSKVDREQMKYKHDGKCFAVLGFAKQDSVTKFHPTWSLEE